MTRNTLRRVLVVAEAALLMRFLADCRREPSSSPQGGGFVVEVVDAQGAPIPDAEVEGSVDYNPGPVASTCCTEKRFANGKTSANGRVTLTGAPFTFHAFHFRASFRDWPPREFGWAPYGGDGVIRIALGPARVVRGRVALGPDCPLSKGLEVSASPPAARAKVAPDGSFVFESLAPWASVWLYACNRSARLDLDIRDDHPVTIALPPP